MICAGTVLTAAIIVLLMVAACSDVATRTIPNRITIFVAVFGVAERLLTGPSAAFASLAASLVLFALLLAAYARGLLGGGDVKLIPAVTLGLSLPAISHFLVLTVMAGGVLAVLHLLARWVLCGRPPSAPPPRGATLLHRVFCAERWRIARHGSLPYAVAIASGGIWVIISEAAGS